ncbi:MAG: hypothetical protein ACE5JF_01950 [Anaerolineales bacterium]
MRSSDRILIGIVIGIIALVLIVFAITLLRPEAEYQSEEDPEGVVHNYLLALQNGDFDRAYQYLAHDLPGHPRSPERFEQNVDRYSYSFHERTDNTLSVDTADISGDLATVKVRETRFYEDGLFDSSQRVGVFEVELRKEEGEWRIYEADAYFVNCWTDDDGCR